MSSRPQKDSPTLLGSAQEFLVEALRHFARGRLNFAIVHAVTAAELVLKERLARENPVLVFQNIDSKRPNEGHTVQLSHLPRRLENLGIPLDTTHEALVREMANWRNQIVHHMPAYDPEAAQKQMPKMLDFLAAYLRSELEMPLEEFLPPEQYRDAARLLTDWQHAVEAARTEAADAGSTFAGIGCPICGETEVVSADGHGLARCHLCGVKLHVVDKCDGCGRKMLTSLEPFPGDNCCEECIAAAGDQYISQYVDYLRGK